MESENFTLSKIFDEVARENTQALIKKDLLLEPQSRKEQSIDVQIKGAIQDDKSHTSKLSEGGN